MSEELMPSLLIEFDPPLTDVQGNKHEMIELREPTGSEVLVAQKELRNGITTESGMKYQIALIAKVSGVSPTAIEKMPISKLNTAANYLQGFMNSGPATGES